MSTDQGLQFRFPAVRTKLQNLFPFDPTYDIEILFKNNKYELQTTYLCLQSGFFRNLNPNLSKLIKIQEQFHEEYFEQVMKCFYGGLFRCPRSAMFQVWKIFQYLKIQTFKKQSIKDIKDNFQKYNFFQVMTFGFSNNIEQIFSTCLAVLDSLDFVQLKKDKEQFLCCPLQVFKFLINTHNRRRKNKRALNFIQMNNLILEYSERKQYSQQFSKDLKFQLIQRTQLTAEQYRLIFIEGSKSQSTRQISEMNLSKVSSQTSVQCLLSQSDQIVSKKHISLEENEHWHQKLQSLKKSFQISQDDYRFMQSSADNLSRILKRKSEQSKLKQRNLSKMETSVREIEKQINDKTDGLRKIQDRIQKIYSNSKTGKYKPNKQLPQQEEQKDQFVESHIIPGYFLGDIMNQAQNTKKQSNLIHTNLNIQPSSITPNFSKNKKSVYETSQAQKQKQTSLQHTYKNCLLFDREPISVPKRYLDSLAKLLDTDEFLKKRQLTLLFRRSKTEKLNMGDPSVIKNRPALLILFQTSQKKFAGGYISVQIPSFTKSESLCDYQAFIFSLTHNVKMPIMKGQQKSAISLSKHYLISFANDLMISNDCLNQVSYCEWPGVYQVPKYSKCASAKQLVGANGQFKIEQIDIYQVKNQQIQMVI